MLELNTAKELFVKQVYEMGELLVLKPVQIRNLGCEPEPDRVRC